MKCHRVFVCIVVCLLLGDSAVLAQTPKNEQDARQFAVDWVRTSLEYCVACEQAYALARSRLYQGLCNRNWTAISSQSQTSNYASLRPAVILDVDETVLDNSPFNERLIKDDARYSTELWNAWCKEMSAEVIPGAREFIEYARGRGIAVFFVSNRTAEVKEATRQNLSRALGYPVPNNQLMLKEERPDWTDAKTVRRDAIAQTHRVLLLIGDDFNDFFRLQSMPPKQRNAIGQQYRRRWGRSWILLPNPVYGTWERTLREARAGVNDE